MGSPENTSNFINAVISEKAFDSISSYIDYAKNADDAEIIAGGKYDKSTGYYNEPTIEINTDKLNEERISLILKNIFNNSSYLFKSINEIEYNKDNIEIILSDKTKIILNNNNNVINELNTLFEFMHQINQNIFKYKYIDFRIENQVIVKEMNIKI